MLVSPAEMDHKASKFVESMLQPGIYDEGSAEKSRQFPSPIKKLAEETGCIFYDAATVAHPGEDGCHLDFQSHKALGDALTELIKDL